MEVRDEYGVPGESEPLRRFLRGEPFDRRAWFEDWASLVRVSTARGVSVSRVRVLSVPHTDYHRWQLDMSALNIEAGEDIRYLPRHLISPEELTTDDWWLFDGELLAYNLVDQEGRPAGAALTRDPQLVAYSQRVQKRTWELAIPYGDYVTAAIPRQQ